MEFENHFQEIIYNEKLGEYDSFCKFQNLM